jgi:pimeloyl-ACP methyl ester carboxylesterase
MPKVKANKITMNYDQQGTGEPLILIPYLTADHACYAFQVGAATGMCLAAKHPDKVQSLSRHSGWPKTDPFLKTVIEGFQIVATALENVPKMVIRAIFPWCLTPELYAAKPDYIQSLADFVLSRPAQPLSAFIQQSNAVIAHDVEAELDRITAPTQITFGQLRPGDLHSFCGSDETQYSRLRTVDL